MYEKIIAFIEMMENLPCYNAESYSQMQKFQAIQEIKATKEYQEIKELISLENKKQQQYQRQEEIKNKTWERKEKLREQLLQDIAQYIDVYLAGDN